MLQRSPNMDIFAENIAFTDNISPRLGHQTNVVQGLEAYSRQLWSLRFHAALLFSRSHVGCPTCIMTESCAATDLPVPWFIKRSKCICNTFRHWPFCLDIVPYTVRMPLRGSSFVPCNPTGHIAYKLPWVGCIAHLILSSACPVDRLRC